MVSIRKTSRAIPVSRAGGTAAVKGTPAAGTISPFAIRPPDPLKAITERKSRPLTEEEKLRILQMALEPYAREAELHLPSPLRDVKQKVRFKMMEHGFSNEVAQEAGDEAVTALLNKRG